MLYFWSQEITEVQVRICNYLFEPDKRLWAIQIYFRGNNQILELAYLYGTKPLTKFDFGNYAAIKHNLIIVFICY